ncbi:D-glycero-alpha-D-manno-heptose-1,7-bisphosphate 7-phosphatase [Flexistipes sinusarabici]|uniref:D,D-heptose 1,7-bisphosphate phosphatase n=1 Tax=Flexistipes sinusarabici TaxID=2352 RepID=A0A3D5Q9S3_FLESI|nr:HAD family hydrolase [Flexistipes sinusarabici]HCW92605.1 D,D-heptose 1,7-bisphosphate phosphatase [Flexistipes sinusarabici]
MAKRPIVFIDRDGTLNKEAGYINHIDNFQLYPFVYQAIRLLNHFNILSVVITNQAGIGRGYFTESFLKYVHNKMFSMLKKNGAFIDGLYYCPHHPSSKLAEYAVECDCRKPKTKMLEKALEEFSPEVDRKKIYVIGDKFSDIKMGSNFGCRTVMVKTGYGKGELMSKDNDSPKPSKIENNFLSAVLWIIRDLNLNVF